jgi:pilus assembly protein CpaD
MGKKLIALLLASAVAACATPQPTADKGLTSVNEPVMSRATFSLDLAAPDGSLAPDELARLDGWFRGLNLGYGDSIFVDGAFADGARSQVAAIAGRYGMMLLPTAPVTAGTIQPGMVRVLVVRSRAEVAGCPNWTTPSQPNFENRTMPNYGCAVNSNLAAMVANPEDLFHGREGPASVDGTAGAKAIRMYRDWPLTGIQEGQAKRPLHEVTTREDD